jgi:hypothetical protein
VFSIDPRDVPALLMGYQFDERQMPGMAANSRIPLPNGFSAPLCHAAFPPEFQSGGHVVVCPDPSQAVALIDLYIE